MSPEHDPLFFPAQFSQPSATGNRRSRKKERSNWLKFEEKFSRDYPSFFHSLMVAFPELSPTELEICAMLRESLLSREIAELLSITEHRVENHRSSIRHKLHLDKTKNLRSFLMGF